MSRRIRWQVAGTGFGDVGLNQESNSRHYPGTLAQGCEQEVRDVLHRSGLLY